MNRRTLLTRLLVTTAFAIVFLAGRMTLASHSAAADAPLADAVMNGNIEAVRTLLRQKVDVNAAQGDGTTALHWAAYREDVEAARLLLAAGANVKAKTRNGSITPLFMAARNGNAAILDLLLKAGAEVNQPDVNGTTALMYAAIAGKPDAATVLLDRGANPNAEDITNGQTAMMFAAASGRAAVIKVLASRGANPNIVTNVSEVIKFDERVRERDQQEKEKKAREDALKPASDKPKEAEAAKVAEKEPTRPGRPVREKIFMGGMTALLFAAREGHLDAAKELVDAGADVNLVSASDKISALTSAIINGHLDLASFLLDRGANPNLATDYGLAPLYATLDAQWAERTWYPAPTIDEEETGYLDLLKSLLTHGANPNARLTKKPWYRTEHGDWVSPVGATPFWLAAKADDVPAMKLFIAAGANPNIASAAGVTPLIVASGYGFEPQVSHYSPGTRVAALRYLIDEVGADVNARERNGYTALHGAALTGDLDAIRYLVAMGGNIKARAGQVFGGTGKEDQKVKEDTGDTVADMANGPRPHNLQYPETVELLMKLGSKNSNNCRASTCVVKTAAPY